MKKNIVLIGGSHGIGLAIARELHQHHSVCVLSRTLRDLETLQVKHLPYDVQNRVPDRSSGWTAACHPLT